MALSAGTGKPAGDRNTESGNRLEWPKDPRTDASAAGSWVPLPQPNGTGTMREERRLMGKRKHTKCTTTARQARATARPSLPDRQAGTVENDPLIGHLVRAELAAVAPRPGYLRGLATAENRPEVAERLRALVHSIKRTN